MKKEFKPADFEEHFITDKSADIKPHKMVPKEHLQDDVGVIAIVQPDGRLSTIFDESHIIKHLSEKINIQRIYVDNLYFEKAQGIVNKFLMRNPVEG
ncbi:MAG: hypothetical protein ACRCTY_08170 [Candidatus Adiutrix sp.]